MKSSTLLIGCLCLFALASTAVLAQDAPAPAKRLHQAASDGDVEQLKLHIANKADLNKADDRGYPPLCYAAEGGNTEAVRLLLDAGAKATATGPDGRTALIGAAQGGKTEIVAALIAAGADVKAKDGSGSTALHMAANMGHLEIVQALIKAGADVNAEDRASQTPLMLAERRQQNEIVDLLKQNGATEPVLMRPGDIYGEQGGMGQGAVTAPATNVEVTLDPNVIREEVKAFDGLEGLIGAVNEKSDTEVKAWIQRRNDNRTTLLRTADKQFTDELAFMKTTATEEKATKTTPAIDTLLAKRKARLLAISDALREERRTAMEQNADQVGMGRGRGVNRGTTMSRGRTTGTAGQSANSPYGNSGTTMARTRARTEPNRPPMDGDTTAQVQAWLSGKPEGKDTLLAAAHKLDLAELDAVRTIATEEGAKRTAAAIGGIMVARQGRVARITNEWRLDDERQARLQERMGTQPGQQGMYGVRGQRGARGGAAGQSPQQPGTTGTRRYR